MKRIIIKIAAIILLGGTAYNLFVVGGLGHSVPIKVPGQCRSLDGMVGSEDIVWDKHARKIYLSSQNRRDFNAPGGIFQVDLNQPFAVLAGERMPGEYPANFHPHGIFLFKALGGAPLLYVVNHASWHSGHSVELFLIKENYLQHVRTMKDVLIRNPNALFVFSENDIYLVNDHAASGGAGKLLEDALALKSADVVHFDGTQWTRVAHDIGYAAGITGTIMDGKKIIMVSAATEHALKEYEVLSDKKLRWRRDIPLGGAPDNLRWDDSGDLWIALHPVPLRFFPHSMSADYRSPSQAVKYSVRTDKANLVYSDKGGTISAATTALATENLLFLGPVFDKHALVCQR